MPRIRHCAHNYRLTDLQLVRRRRSRVEAL